MLAQESLEAKVPTPVPGTRETWAATELPGKHDHVAAWGSPRQQGWLRRISTAVRDTKTEQRQGPLRPAKETAAGTSGAGERQEEKPCALQGPASRACCAHKRQKSQPPGRCSCLKLRALLPPSPPGLEG